MLLLQTFMESSFSKAEALTELNLEDVFRILFTSRLVFATYTDPGRTNNFPQDWTIYYWAYWMVWCIAAPFFIGNISRGRTIRQTILGGYAFGVGSTISSFVVLGNYSLGLQTSGAQNFIAQYEASRLIPLKPCRTAYV